MTPLTTTRSLSRDSLAWMLLAIAGLWTSCAPALSIARPLQIQAWVVYFDAERGLGEVREHGALFDRISLFAYELNTKGQPRPAPRVEQMTPGFLRLAEETGFEPWVTVVNDVRYSSDSAVPKDSSLVHKLIADSVQRAAHVSALASRAARDGFAGLHLDYERVPESDSGDFRAFVEELRAELARHGLGLEVVVEPLSGPLPEPNTTNVTVMAYDLHGFHSGPGPRSTPEFVSGLVPRAVGDADSAAGLAVAVGGFAWEPDGTVRSLDWSLARQLSAEASSRARGKPDGVPSALLDDGTELWFEDRESLLSKWDAAWRSGFRRLSLWRLGGNDEALFGLLRELRRASTFR